MSDWYCKLAGDVVGPFSVDEVRFLKSRGKLAPDDEVRQGDAGDWVSVESVGMFSGDAAAPSASGSGPAIRTVTPRGSASSSPVSPPTPTESSELLEVSGEPGIDDAASSQQLDPLIPNAPPPLPDKPQQMGTRERVMIGACIGAGMALLILLLVLLFLWPAGFGGSRGSVAGRGVGHGGGDGLGEGVGDGDGKNDGDSSGNAETEEPSPAGAETDDEEIVEESGTGEPSDAPPTSAPPDDTPPPEEEMPEGGLFTVSELSSGDDGPASEGGGGAGLGEFNRRLDREGAKSGDVQVSLLWNNFNDLDLHVRCPSGEEISYQRSHSRCGGELDVDMNAGGRASAKPVENVYWPEGGAPQGKFFVMVNHYANHGGRSPTKFTVAVTVDGQTKRFSGSIRLGQPKRDVHSFTRR
jgi:uncharacterized protein DUF4339